jgi:phosphoserine phosphatase RsbU/P
VPRLELTLIRPNRAPMALHIDGEVITMGRSSDCAIPIDDRFLSRKHAEIVADGSGWVLRDNGSVNGTFVNGARIQSQVKLGPGDRIRLGDAELVIGGAALAARDEPATLTDFFLSEADVRESDERSRIVHRLALELIADRPMSELFDFILDRVVEVLHPSRAALALLEEDGQSVEIVNMRPANRDPRELSISRTLVREVVRDRKVVAFKDDGGNAALAAAHSIVAQSIYSALCAPLIAGDAVLGVLYIDYQLTRRKITEDDAQLAAQIARVAAIKLESTRLRESALEKGKLDETLKLAHAIQMRMLPQVPDLAPGTRYDIAASIRPAKQVGGDFYDFHATADGKLYFCIGDVSGKGIPSALMMAVSRALFRSFILAGREPAEVMSAVNRQLCDETDDTMFVTAFCGVLDLARGELRYANAGHNPPMMIRADGTVSPIPTRPGLVLGYLPLFDYKEESAVIGRGDLLYLYTDGISEAARADGELFSVERLTSLLGKHAATAARNVVQTTLTAVDDFVGDAPQSDDLTLLCIRYLG